MACAERGDWQLAISSLRTMRLDGLEPDDVSHNCALKPGRAQPCTASHLDFHPDIPRTEVVQVAGTAAFWEVAETLGELNASL